jgi:hypothetical protein
LLRSLPEIDRENDTGRFPSKPAATTQSATVQPTAHGAVNDRITAPQSIECTGVSSELPDPGMNKEGKSQKPNKTQGRNRIGCVR